MRLLSTLIQWFKGKETPKSKNIELVRNIPNDQPGYVTFTAKETEYIAKVIEQEQKSLWQQFWAPKADEKSVQQITEEYESFINTAIPPPPEYYCVVILDKIRRAVNGRVKDNPEKIEVKQNGSGTANEQDNKVDDEDLHRRSRL